MQFLVLFAVSIVDAMQVCCIMPLLYLSIFQTSCHFYALHKTGYACCKSFLVVTLFSFYHWHFFPPHITFSEILDIFDQ